MTIDELVDIAELAVGDSYQQCNMLMIECLSSIEKVLPKVGLEALATTKRYWIENDIEKDSLEIARIRCWDYLDERAATTNVLEKEFCSLRAVICTLYPMKPSSDIGELLDFFFEMVTSINEETDIIESVIRNWGEK